MADVLAALGAIIIFDISEGNKRYAVELANVSKVQIDYHVGYVLDLQQPIVKILSCIWLNDLCGNSVDNMFIRKAIPGDGEALAYIQTES